MKGCFWGAAIYSLCLASTGHAQPSVGIGPQIGINRTAGYFRPNDVFATTARTSFEGGVCLNIGWGHWALQPAVSYVSHQFLLTYDNQTLDASGAVLSTLSNRLAFHLNYVTMPIKLVYSLKANGQGFQTFMGGYVSRFLGGHLDYTYSLVKPGLREELAGRQEVVPGSGPENDAKQRFGPWDAGLQAGIGYRYANILVQASYNASVVNGGRGFAVNPTYYPNRFATSLTYFFGKTAPKTEQSSNLLTPAKLLTPRYSLP